SENGANVSRHLVFTMPPRQRGQLVGLSPNANGSLTNACGGASLALLLLVPHDPLSRDNPQPTRPLESSSSTHRNVRHHLRIARRLERRRGAIAASRRVTGR